VYGTHVRYGPAVIMAAATVAAVAIVPRVARACSCAASFASIEWPRDGASDLPRDTPLVISHYDWSGGASALAYTLAREDGTTVALAEVERLAPPFEGCGANGTIFLRPVGLLDPGASYKLSLSPAAVTGGTGGRFTATFTVGDGTFTPEPVPDLQLLYLHVEGTTPCVGARCGIAEIHVDLGAPTPEPRWLVVESAAVENGKNEFLFWPKAWSPQGNAYDRASHVSVELPDDDRCVQIRLFGLDGMPLLDELRCEPDRCALSDIRSVSTCGGPAAAALDAARIPDGSCDEPPVIAWREGEGPLYPEPRETAAPADETDEGPVPASGGQGLGCSVAPGGADAGSAASFWLLLAVGVRRIARSRQRSRAH